MDWVYDYKTHGVPSRRRPKIRMLTDCFGWNAGDEFVIQMETSRELYFDDVNDRWTYIERTDEGKEFEYVRRYKGE